MKILQVINSFEGGGAEKLMLDLHEGFLGKGIDSHAVSLESSNGRLPNCYSLGLNSCYQISALFRLFVFLNQPQWRSLDIIHVHLFPSQFFVPLLIKILRINAVMVTTEHSTLNRRINSFVGKILDPILYGSYEKTICNSQGTLKMMMDWQPQIVNKLLLIYNGINTNKYWNSIEDNSGNKCLIIISVGRLAPPKNYASAIMAMSKLSTLNFEYWIVGAGVLESELKSLVKRLKIEQKIKFLGFRDDIPELLTQADIFLQTSLWEGFGLAVVEAMSAGLPVVVSDVPGVQEVVGDNTNCGFLVNPTSENEITQKIKTLIDNPPLRRSMGDNARIQAANFDISKTINQHLNLYYSVCKT
jgi:glycosyltransferase involved in cell wall biosynthesis